MSLASIVPTLYLPSFSLDYRKHILHSGMGSYGYDPLHRHTPGINRAWGADPPPEDRGYSSVKRAWGADRHEICGYSNDFPPEPYTSSYGTASLDRSAHTNSDGLGNGVPADRYTPMYDIPTNRLSVPNRYSPKYDFHTDRFNNGFTPGFGVAMEGDRYANGYGNGVQIREPMREPTRESMREPIRQPMREPMRNVRKVSPSLRPLERGLSNQVPLILPAREAVEDPPLAGMIFGCTTETYQECMQLQLFGLPATSRRQVRRVVPGSKLFLYNYRERELSGIFEATSRGDINIVPGAFRRWGSFPAQVRIRCVEKCPNLLLKAFKDAISENFEKNGNKFKYDLNEVQVRRLIELFRQETEYWQRHREVDQRDFQQTQLQPGLRPVYPTVNEGQYPQRNGNDSGLLVTQLRSSNNGGLLMAAPVPHLGRPSPSPSRQAGPNVLRPPGFSPFSGPRPTPWVSKVWHGSHAPLAGTEAASVQSIGRDKEKGSSVPSSDRRLPEKVAAKKATSSLPENGQSGQGKLYDRWPVARGVASAKSTAFSSELHKETSTSCDEGVFSSPGSPQMGRKCSKLEAPGGVFCEVGNSGTGAGGCWEDNGTPCSVIGKQRREDASEKPKSRKKMKASKTRSNVIGGKSLLRSPQEGEG